MSFIADQLDMRPLPSTVTAIAAELRAIEERCERGDFPGDISEDVSARMTALDEAMIRVPARTLSELALKLAHAASMAFHHLTAAEIRDMSVEDATFYSASVDAAALLGGPSTTSPIAAMIDEIVDKERWGSDPTVSDEEGDLITEEVAAMSHIVMATPCVAYKDIAAKVRRAAEITISQGHFDIDDKPVNIEKYTYDDLKDVSDEYGMILSAALDLMHLAT